MKNGRPKQVSGRSGTGNKWSRSRSRGGRPFEGSYIVKTVGANKVWSDTGNSR